jgi:hypothetical protein
MTHAVALHDLGRARDILDEWLEEAAGEQTPELEQLLSDLDVQAETKIVNVALYIREQLATSLAIDDEIERLTKRRDARKNAADRLKRYLEAWMDRLGKTKVTDPRCTVALQLNNPSVKGELSPATMAELHAAGSWMVKHVPESYVLDRRAALEVHKQGLPIPEGLTVERSKSLRIR